MRLPIGPRNLVMVVHPDLLRRVLQENVRNYAKNYAVIQELLGNGLATSNGEIWLRQRRLMQPAFHHRQITMMVELMAAEIARLRERWRAVAASGVTLNLAEEMLALAQAIIMRTMFSAEPSEDSAQIGTAFAVAMRVAERKNYRPSWMPRRVYAQEDGRYNQAVAFLEQRVFAMIAERRRAGSDRGDLLDMLLTAQDAESGEYMSDQQIRDEVMTIYFAGHETTANVLTWTFVLLARHPDVAQRLRAEYAEKLAGGDPGAADLGQLTYGRQVLDEVMRLLPPAWMVTRVAVQDDQLGGYHIPAGSRIALSPYLTHRMAEFWPDPERFDPNRHSPELAAGRHKFAYVPFILGPRKCIGDAFALTEMQLALPMLLQHFILTEAPGEPVQPMPQGTLRPSGPVMMEIRQA